MAKKEEEAKPEEQQVELPPEETGSKKKIVIMAVAGLVLLAVLGGGGYFGYKAFFAKPLTPEEQAKKKVEEEKKKKEKEKKKKEEGGGGHGGGEAAKKDASVMEASEFLGPIVKLDPFIVNLADTSGRRYLKATMEVELSSEDVLDEVKARMPQVKDAVVMILSSKTYDEIGGPDGKIALREQLIAHLNGLFKDGKIKKVYFTEFVVQ